MDFNAVTPAIVLVIYCLVEVAKKFWLKEDKQRTMLPVICIAGGAIIALLLYFFYPQGGQYTNAVEAVASGGLSGIAATGCNQLWKQFQKYSGNATDDTPVG